MLRNVCVYVIYRLGILSKQYFSMYSLVLLSFSLTFIVTQSLPVLYNPVLIGKAHVQSHLFPRVQPLKPICIIHILLTNWSWVVSHGPTWTDMFRCLLDNREREIEEGREEMSRRQKIKYSMNCTQFIIKFLTMDFSNKAELMDKLPW